MKITQDKLLAAMDDLEKSASIRKGGDALQSAAHDGGFATEGTNIQSKAKAMKKALKTLVKGGMSPEDAEKTLKALAGSDDDSSSDDAAKGFGGDDASSDDDAGGGDDEMSSAEADAGSDDEAPIGKSLGAAQLANASRNKKRDTSALRKALTEEHPEMSGAFDAAPILDSLVKSIDRLAAKQSGISKNEVGDLRKSIVQVQHSQNEFNGRLAKALTMIAGRVIEIESLVKSIHSEPVQPNRAPTLRKSDIVNPHLHGGETNDIDGTPQMSPLAGIEMLKIQEALVEICMKGGADVMDITKFENSKGNLSTLPPNVVKQLEARLCPAA